MNRSVFEAELADVVPICRCSIAGTRIIGRLTAGYVLHVNRGAHKLRMGTRLTMRSQKSKGTLGTYQHDGPGVTAFEECTTG